MRKLLWLVVLMFLVSPAFALGPQDIARITVQELKARLDNGEDIVVVDVRSGSSYDSSGVKIRGAVRISPYELEQRASELPPGKELALYCT